MALLTWSSKYSVGIDSIDKQHQKLIAIINDLNEAMKNRRSNEVLGKTLNELIIYTKTHFKYEEDLFSKLNYIEKSAHKVIHDKFIKDILLLNEDFKSGKKTVSIDLINYLNDWIIKHIMGTDKKYTEFFVKNGVK